MPEIYQPEEDSYLISEVLKKELPKILKFNHELNFLEIGIGSGINLKAALKSGIKKENILGTDINEEAVNHCINLGFDCIKSDLFDKVNGKFNVIAFNPPYLPEDEKEPVDSRRETTGGEKGNELTIKFIQEAGDYLKENGVIFVVTSSLSKRIGFDYFGYNAEEVGHKNLFFEKLSVWKLEVK